MLLRQLFAFVASRAGGWRTGRDEAPGALQADVTVIIKCNGCGHSVAYGPTLPDDCSYCGTPIQSHLLARNKPTVNVAPKQAKKGELTAHDRRFLRSLRISQDVDPLS